MSARADEMSLAKRASVRSVHFWGILLAGTILVLTMKTFMMPVYGSQLVPTLKTGAILLHPFGV